MPAAGTKQGDWVEGIGTAGSPAGGVLTVQGNPGAGAAGLVTVGGYVFDTVAAAWVPQRSDGDGVSVTSQRITPTFVTVQGAANAITTLTIAASGAGLFHKITYIHIARTATAALAGGANLQVTTTNIVGLANAWRTGNLMVAGGTEILVDQTFPSPIRSQTANTPTTIVCPAAGAAVHWTIVVGYYDSDNTR